MDKVKKLIKQLNNKNVDLRKSAAHALRRIGIPAVESLLELLHSKKRATAQSAVYPLGRIGDIRAVEPLIIRPNNRNPDVPTEAKTAQT